MQQARKKPHASHLSIAAPEETIPSLSSFSLVHRFGKLEIVKIRQEPSFNNDYFTIPALPGWSMPPIPIGYIKCRNFDFL